MKTNKNTITKMNSILTTVFLCLIGLALLPLFGCSSGSSSNNSYQCYQPGGTTAVSNMYCESAGYICEQNGTTVSNTLCVQNGGVGTTYPYGSTYPYGTTAGAMEQGVCEGPCVLIENYENYTAGEEFDCGISANCIGVVMECSSAPGVELECMP